MRGRFAPSPSGTLHRGNLRTALLSWLDVRLRSGEWLLRIDDLDTPRNRAGSEQSILADLRWLGLHHDGPVLHQSDARGLYGTVLSWFRRAGLLYPCRCSRRDLADVSAPHTGLTVYPGTCRSLPRGWGWEQGRLPSWRLRLPTTELRWRERYGAVGRVDGPSAVGDVVLRRADGRVAYHLATAVDELRLGISDVLRGEDLWSSTAPQVAVIQLLGGRAPRYGHLPLCRERSGERLSKRDGSLGIEGYRARGLDAAAVVGELAASVGLVPPGSRISARELLQDLSPERFDRAVQAAVGAGAEPAAFRRRSAPL
ncbi:MAG: tRNA glutamyl-Q(34) synthetase GluQRS [Cyanobacteriota bacterium]|nr:tRNA glutamyl-Q(34) synthetase GluQRS [Cyanobacteriota bacterium]